MGYESRQHLPEEQLCNSPSKDSHQDPNKELVSRQKAAIFMHIIGQKLYLYPFAQFQALADFFSHT